MVDGAVVVIRNMNVREIFDAVIRGTPFLEPDNREVTTRCHANVSVFHEDDSH